MSAETQFSWAAHIVVALLALALMCWGMMIDVERGQTIPGKALFVAAGSLFVLNIYSMGFV